MPELSPSPNVLDDDEFDTTSEDPTHYSADITAPLNDALKQLEKQREEKKEPAQEDTKKEPALEKGFFNITEENIAQKMKQLDNFETEIRARIDAARKGDANMKAFKNYEITFAVSSGQVAYRVAHKIDTINKLVKENGLTNEIKIKDLVTTKEKAEEVRQGYLLGKKFKSFNTVQIPVFRDDEKSSGLSAMDKVKSYISQLNTLLRMRSTAGFPKGTFKDQPLKAKLPDGLNISNDVAQYLKDKLVAARKEFPGMLELREGDARIHESKSKFRDLFIRKSHVIQITAKDTPESARQKIEALSEKLLSYKDTSNQKRFKLMISNDFKGDISLDVTTLEILHQRLKDTSPNYSGDNLVIEYYTPAHKVTPKSQETPFEDIDFDRLAVDYITSA